MVSLLSYKVALLVLLAGVPTSVGAGAYYNQQQNSTLNSQISGVSHKLDNANSQISSLNNQLSSQSSQISQLQSQNSQLQSQITQLQNQLSSLSKNLQTLQTILVSQGDIRFDTHGWVPPGYINFTIASLVSATLNVSFTVQPDINGGVVPGRLVLLSQSQFNAYVSCNCLYFDNFTNPATWESPWISGGSNSYAAQIRLPIPSSGIWILIFQTVKSAVGANVTWVITEKVVLSTLPVVATTQTTKIFNGVLQGPCCGNPVVLNFSVPLNVISASLNISVTGLLAPFYIQLLNPAQYKLFQPWSNNPATWVSPVVASITTVVSIPSSGSWSLLFQNQQGSTGQNNQMNVSLSLTITQSS
jgi:hypothetical protein